MSRLAEMQARFQQRQMQEKEEKLLRLYETQQQRAFEKVSRGSSGSSSVSGGTSPVGVTNTTPGRVRQMFDERRQKAGIDRSYPLEPLKQTTRLNGHVSATRVSSLDRSNTTTKSSGMRQSMTVKTSVQRSVSHSQTGKPVKSRSIKQTSNAIYNNGKLVEQDNTYEQSNEDENDHAINMLKQQQKELEMMMNNHNINDDTLDDEELPQVDIDEVDEGNENNYILSNENLRQNVSNENIPTVKTTSRTPPVASNESRHKPTAKRTISKTSPIVKSSPRSTPKTGEKKSVMRSVSGASKSNPSMPGKSSLTSKATPTRTARVPQSATVNDNLAGCKFCQRRFAPDRLEKHEEICGRTLKKKRKAYDAVKHRVQGTEAECYTKKGTKSTSTKTKAAPAAQKSDWRRKHEEFINAIRAAKTAQAHVAAGGKLSDLPPPPPSLNPDYVQCPHCSRRFNETAAARHIPKCATMLHNKPAKAVAKKK